MYTYIYNTDRKTNLLQDMMTLRRFAQSFFGSLHWDGLAEKHKTAANIVTARQYAGAKGGKL